MHTQLLNQWVPRRFPERRKGVAPQACEDGSCAPDASAAGDQSGHYPFVYAIGNVEIRFPSLGVEKEFVQATGRADTGGLTDQQALQTILAQPQNRYLSRQVCWVFVIEGLEHYLLQPRESTDYDMLLEAVRANPSRQDLDVVVGLRGPVAPPTMCNGVSVPIVSFSQIYSFDRDSFVNNVPVPEEQDEGRFRPAVGEVLDRFLKVVDNAGATDEHRALNYLATRYPAVYNLSAERFSAGFSLMAIETAPSRLSGTRRLITVSFVFANRETQLPDRYSVRVDVTEEFPFLTSTLTPAPFIER
jgi:cyclic patellamide precursor peptide PatG